MVKFTINMSLLSPLLMHISYIGYNKYPENVEWTYWPA